MSVKKRLENCAHFLRHHAFLFARKTINIGIAVYVLYLSKYKKNGRSKFRTRSKSNVYVYQMVSSEHFFLGLLSLLSFYFFSPVEKPQCVIMNDGSLKNFHKWLLTKLPFAVSITDCSDIPKSILNTNTNIRNLFLFGWSGKKFIYPLVKRKKSLCILLDSDTLFLRPPTQIINWMKNPLKQLYLQDYLNFSVISSIEVEHILGKKPVLSKVNSGLLCINTKTLWQKNSLTQIDTWIKEIIDTVTDRMTFDYFSENKMVYVFPLIEQTLHRLLFERTESKKLSSAYIVTNPDPHQQLKQLWTKKTFIHFTGEHYRKRYYWYLLLSFHSWIKNKISRTPNSFPWFMSFR